MLPEAKRRVKKNFLYKSAGSGVYELKL